MNVYYDESIVGEFIADMLVEGTVLVEVKAVEGLIQAHIGQCLNYLRATELGICLLLNFGQPKVQVKRVVSNH